VATIWPRRQHALRRTPGDNRVRLTSRKEPAVDVRASGRARLPIPNELGGIIPANRRNGLRVRQNDRSRSWTAGRLQRLKALYGPTLVTGFADLDGTIFRRDPGQQRVLFSTRARVKATHFIKRMCCLRKVPLVFLQKHHRLHRGQGVRAPRHSRRTGPRWCTRVANAQECRSSPSSSGAASGPATTGYVRARLPAAPALDVSERADLGDGGEQAASVLAQVKQESSSGRAGA